MENMMPDVQEMDMKYDSYYLVPFPDCQKFEELDEDSIYVIPAYVEGKPVCFVDAWWVGNNYDYED